MPHAKRWNGRVVSTDIFQIDNNQLDHQRWYFLRLNNVTRWCHWQQSTHSKSSSRYTAGDHPRRFVANITQKVCSLRISHLSSYVCQTKCAGFIKWEEMFPLIEGNVCRLLQDFMSILFMVVDNWWFTSVERDSEAEKNSGPAASVLNLSLRAHCFDRNSRTKLCNSAYSKAEI